LLAVLLVPGVAEEVRGSSARRILVANLMTQPGETQGMDLLGHLEAFDRHAGVGLVQDVLVHAAALPAERLTPYLEAGAEPIVPSRLDGRPERLHTGNLITPDGKIRHDPRALAATLLAMMRPRPAEKRDPSVA
jgi:uncharacterized cofD-like protein